MSITLSKGGKLNLTKKEPALKKILIGLGWDMVSNNSVDLDASVFMVTAAGKVPTDEFFIFYNNLKSPDNSVQHTGDNRTGVGDADDEMVLANLATVSTNIKELIVVVSIHEANERNHHFGLLKEAYIRIVDVENNREIVRYNLDQNNSRDTDIEFGRLRLEENEWHFVATGAGAQKGLQGYVDMYV
jgi:tellurium resistance protein TerD